MKYLLTLALLAFASPLYACHYGTASVVVGNAYAVTASPVIAAQYSCPAALVAPQVAPAEHQAQVVVQPVAVGGYGYGAVSAFAVNHNVHNAVQAVVVRRRANVVVGHSAVRAVSVNAGRAAVVVNGGGRQRANVVVNQGGGRQNIAVNAPGVRVRVRGR